MSGGSVLPLGRAPKPPGLPKAPGTASCASGLSTMLGRTGVVLRGWDVFLRLQAYASLVLLLVGPAIAMKRGRERGAHRDKTKGATEKRGGG